MSQNKKQHYVPQFYLKYFSENGKSVGNYLISSDKLIHDSPISNTAQKSYFYSKDKDDLEIEKQLGLLEIRFSKILKKIVFSRHIPDKQNDPEGYVDMLLFFSVQIARTKYSADNSDKIANILLNPYIESNLNKSDLSEAKKIELLQSLDDYKIKLDVPNQIPLSNVPYFTNFLIDLKSSLFISTGKSQFISSDVPVVRYNYLARKLNYQGSGTGLSHKGLMLFLPLSPKIVLMLYDEKCYEFEKKIHLKKLKDVRHINELIIKNAYENLFFRKDIPFKQLESLIKLLKESGSNEIIHEEIFKEISGNSEIIHTEVPYVNELINIPKIKLTEDGKNVISPTHMGWLPRLQNPYSWETLR